MSLSGLSQMRIAYCVPKVWMSPTPGRRLIGSCKVLTMKSLRSAADMLPSSETRPTTSRKLFTDLLTRTPCCCTSCGRSGVASATLFCTCTCAMSASVPPSKVIVIVTVPAEVLADSM